MRILFMGTGEFAEPTFEALITGPHSVVGLVTNPDRPAGKERTMTRHIKDIALKHQVAVFQPESVNTPDSAERVRAFQADLLVVAAYGQILSNDVLNAAPLGGINVHASLLPKYRGAAPINWAIYHGEKQSGVTIIRMSTKLDAGDMLAQQAIDILPDETAGELEARLAELGAKLASQIVARLAAGPVVGKKQDPALVTKAPKLKKEHGLIDWQRKGLEVANHIRAMNPWPTAYTFLHRKDHPPLRVIINKAVGTNTLFAGCLALEEHVNEVAGGTVTELKDNAIVVAPRIGAVELHWLQPAGKRVMTAAEFVRGYHVKVGNRFGAERE